MTSYPTAQFRRTGLVPGVLAAIVLVAGSVLLGSDGFIWILYAVSILALIMCVFAWQGKAWWWILAFAPVAVAWNPVYPLPLEGIVWQAMQFVVALVFVAAGMLIKVRNPDDRNAR